MKKVISLLLSLTMLLSIVSVVDLSAYADTLTTGKCGDNVKYSFESDTGTLTISGTGNMYDYNNNYRVNPFYNNTDIKVITINYGITSIGNYAFEDCTNLTSVTISDSVTSIGGRAFYYCKSLTSVTIPDSVTSIGGGAFEDCTSLTSVTIPDSVTSIGYSAFRSCTSLTSVTIPDGVTSIGDLTFSGCTSLTSIEVSNNNKSYSSIDGVLFNNDKTKLMQYPIGNERTTYNIPNGVTSIGHDAFEYCSSLASVTIPNSVTSIDSGAFEYCKALSSVTIPDSVTSIGYLAFNGCKSLTNITIPDSVTSIGDSAFSGCTSLISINVEENNIKYFSVNGVLFNRNQNKLMYYPAGKNDKNYEIPGSVTSIGSYAFGGCRSLTNITIPDSVTSIGTSAFSSCTSLTNITIPNCVTSIGSCVFYKCASLTSIEVSNNNENYSSLDGVLFNKNKTELITYPAGKGQTDSDYVIPNSVTSIGDFAFGGCTSLTSVTIPDSVTSIGYDAFSGCTGLTSITIPDSITSIGAGAFEGCTSLTSITIPDSVTSIGAGAFRNTEYYNDESNWDNGVLYISNCLIYAKCDELVGEYSIKENTRLIGDSAFYNCTSLTSVTIPNSVTSIGSYAFNSCTNLKSIIVLTPDCEFGSRIVGINVKIYGFANSTANKYANSNGNIFINIYCNDYNLEHNYTSKVLTQPTCTKKGITRYTCSRCGDCYDKENIATLGGTHNYVSKVLTQPTCTKKGITRYTCSRCGDSYDKEDIAALDHNYVSKVLTQPTCTEKGTTRYTCSRCGYSYDEEDIEALGDLGHNYVSKVIKQPTCTEKGTTRYTCSYCGDYYDEENIAALGGAHNYVSKVLTQPTCTKKGVTRYTCTRCGDYYDKEDIAALGHNYVSKVLTQATCTEKGVTRYTCSRCGDSYDKDDTAALGHNYVSKVLTQPTCTEKGVTRYTCTRCNNYYDKEDIEELGHDTKIVERVEPTLTEDGFYRVECQRDGCGYSSSHPLEQLTLGYNQKVKSNGSDTYKIEMDKSGYLIFDFEGESKKWDINIYDEDYNKIDTLKPVYKEFYKKSYLQISLGSNVPNKNQIAALFAGKYYVEIDRLNDDTNDNFSGNYTFSIDYSPANETIKETKNDFYYDAPTAKNIELNKTYNGFLGAKYACYNYVGNPILTTDERDAYKIEIPQGSGLSQFSVTLSSKAFAPLGSDCTLILYNSEFEPYDGFKPLTVSLNSTLNETIYLYEGTYYIAVVNDKSPIEYTFTTTFKPQGTFTCVEHKGKLVNTVNPTCTQNGYNSYVCQICGTQYNEIIPAYGHNVVIDYEVAPTLVSSGLTRGSHCSICGAVITPQTVIPQISAPTTTPTTAAKAVAKPKSAKFKKVKSAKKAISVEWKKVSGVKGYQIQVATDKKFKKNKKTVTVKKQKTTKTTIKKLKAKKKYYVRIRTYKTVNGKKVYSSWSKVKSVKTK